MVQQGPSEVVARKTILVLGASGQLGFEVTKAFACIGNIIAPSRTHLDLANPAEVNMYLEKVNPDLIINAAAFTAVDVAENESELAWKLNAGLVRSLASYVRKQATKSDLMGGASSGGVCQFIHFSTDYVYHSHEHDKLTEESECEPLSIYGQTKLAGDNEILQQLAPLAHEHQLPLYLIFRISWVFSERRQNFALTMLRLSLMHTELHIVDDQVGAPISASLVAQIAQLSHCSGIPAGVYNLTCRGETNWFEFANTIFSKAESLGLITSKPDVFAVSSRTYGEGKKLAPRPSNSRLCIEKIEKALSAAYQMDWQMPEWQVPLNSTLEMLYDLKGK